MYAKLTLSVILLQFGGAIYPSVIRKLTIFNVPTYTIQLTVEAITYTL